MGDGYESIKYQGPEAVHDGDLCVRRKGEGAVCDKEALSGDAKGRRWASHGKQMKVDQEASGIRMSVFKHQQNASATPVTRRTAAHVQKRLNEP